MVPGIINSQSTIDMQSYNFESPELEAREVITQQYPSNEVTFGYAVILRDQSKVGTEPSWIYSDELGEYDDWFELYNPGDKDINIEGMYVTDSPGNELYKIPSSSSNAMTIPSKGYLVLWCDKESEQGANHLEMKLKTEGEYIFLIDTDSVTIIDSVSFGMQEADISFGRSPDGADNWELFSVPTPGRPNK